MILSFFCIITFGRSAKFMEKNNEKIAQELDRLPKCSIVNKTIKGKTRVYLQWRDQEGKTRSKYLKAEEVDSYRKALSSNTPFLVSSTANLARLP